MLQQRGMTAEQFEKIMQQQYVKYGNSNAIKENIQQNTQNGQHIQNGPMALTKSPTSSNKVINPNTKIGSIK